MQSGPDIEISCRIFICFPDIQKNDEAFQKNRKDDDPHLNASMLKQENIDNDPRAERTGKNEYEKIICCH